MKRRSHIIVIQLLILILIYGCGKGIVVHPNEFQMGAISLYANGTYDFTYGEHDVAGVLVNLGEYTYSGDTLILYPNSRKYLEKLTQPRSDTCNTDQIVIHFKEYLSAYDDGPWMSRMYWFEMKLLGINDVNDTIKIWNPNSVSGGNDFSRVVFPKNKFENITRIWIETYDMKIVEDIMLPKEYDCLDITVPMINLGAQIRDEYIVTGMNKFVIRQIRENKYRIEIIGREKVKWEIETASNKR